jgi:hypothetical protein
MDLKQFIGKQVLIRVAVASVALGVQSIEYYGKVLDINEEFIKLLGKRKPITKKTILLNRNYILTIQDNEY